MRESRGSGHRPKSVREGRFTPVMLPWLAWAACVWALGYAARRTVRRSQVQVAPGVVHYDTVALNEWPAAIVRPCMYGRAYRAVLALYDVGIVVAGLAMVASLAVVLVTCCQLFLRVSPRLAKRDAIPDAAPLWLTPLVPGVNLPLRHAAALVPVGLVSQMLHEAGHAVAAALHHVEPLSMGLYVFFPAIPVAYVQLPEQLRGQRARLQVVSAGVWHNAMLVLCFVLASSLASVFWTDAQSLRVSAPGPLRADVPRNSRITALNDVPVSAMPPTERLHAWTRLVHDTPWPAEPGWCIPPATWTQASDACCHEPSDSLACFSSASEQRCMLPLDIFVHSTRCHDTCSQGFCAAPRDPLARLYLDDDLVVLRGPFRGLSQTMRISTKQLRFPWIYLVPEVWADTLAHYGAYLYQLVFMVNVALLLINMLPIPALDGSAYLQHAMGLPVSSHEAYDLEDPAAMPRPTGQRLLLVIQGTTCILTGLALVGSIWVSALPT